MRKSNKCVEIENFKDEQQKAKYNEHVDNYLLWTLPKEKANKNGIAIAVQSSQAGMYINI